MKRNIAKAMQEGRKLADNRPALDLTASELQAFFDTFNKTAAEQGTANAVFNLIGDAYSAGLAIGNRNA